MKRVWLLIFFLFVITTLRAGAEPLYLTFVHADRNLQKSQVSLKINKEDQKIDEFFLVDTTNRSTEILSHPAGRRQYVLLFDLIFSKPEDLLTARNTADSFFAKMGTGDLIAIAGISAKSGLRFYSTFTTDRNKLRSGLNALGRDTVEGMIQGPDGNYYPAQFSSNEPPTPLIPDEQFLHNVKVDTGKKEKQGPIFVHALAELTFALAEVEGRRNVILFSPGFENKNVRSSKQSEWQSPELIMGRTEPGEPPQEAPPSEQQPSTSFSLEDVEDLAAGSDCHFHVIQSDTRENDFYKKLTGKTAGIYLKMPGDSSTALDQILTSDQTYYVIGWENATKQLADLYPLKLEVAGTKILTTDTWIMRRPYTQYSSIEKKIQVSEAIYKNYQKPSPEDHYLADFFYQQGATILSSFFQIPGSEITKAGETDLEFYSFATDSEGNLLDFDALPSVRMDLNSENLQKRLATSGLKGWSVLLAKAGKMTIRWIIINAKTGETFTSSLPIEIVDSAVTTTNPFFPATNFDWIIWPAPPDQKTKRGVAVQYPYIYGEKFFFPDLSPTFTKGGKAHVLYHKIYHLPSQDKHPPIQFTLVDPAGKSIEISNFGLKMQPKVLDHGGIEVFWNILSFPDVTPGPYRCVVHITDTSQKREIEASADLTIRKQPETAGASVNQ